ncbi:MAG: HD domain-containing protein [Candidatus Omnitrophica bacterium]|nr:HD domain-containing protein [Candidatus Omnitrophota bacterium]
MAGDLNKLTVSRDLLIKETQAREKAQNILLRKSMEYEKKLENEVELKTQELKETVNRLKKASLETIYRLSLAAEYRDGDTGKHLLRMSHYTAAIARKLGLDKKYVEAILYASLMHDVGKIGISDTILLKPGKLTPYEWEVMKKHTLIGARMLQDSEAEFIDLARNIALTHHERWDGSGYPNGLKGEEIDLAGRITAIADVFDAVTSTRPYKEAFSVEAAFEIIWQGRGTHFDPRIVDAFFEIKEEILEIMNNEKLLNAAETIIMNGHRI